MQKIILIFLVFMFALAIPNKYAAQTQRLAPHLPRGRATDVSSGEIQALVQKTAAAVVSDQALRVVSINGEYNVGVGVVHRAKTAGRDAGGGIKHSQITEIYHVIPPNTPHWFSEITSDQIVYLVVRIDPQKVLPAGYVPK